MELGTIGRPIKAKRNLGLKLIFSTFWEGLIKINSKLTWFSGNIISGFT